MLCLNTDFPFFVHHELNYSVFLHRVFHSIRFKVIKVGATAVALFLFFLSLFPYFLGHFSFNKYFFEEN